MDGSIDSSMTSFRNDPKEVMQFWVFGLIITVVLHASIILAFLISQKWAMQSGDHHDKKKGHLNINFEKVALLKYGEIKLKPKQLPRLTKRVEKKVDKSYKTITKKEDVEKKVDPDQKKKEIEAAKRRYQDERSVDEIMGVEDNPVKNTKTYGDPEGSKYGDSLTGRKGVIWLDTIIAYYRIRWKTPNTIDDSVLRGLSADIYFYISKSGRITTYRFLKKSGNDSFDTSVKAVIEKYRTLPEMPKDEKLKEYILQNGFKLTFEGKGKI